MLGLRGWWHYQGLGWFIYHLGSFFKEILNMMTVKIIIACSMCCFQNSMESGGMNSMTLPNLDYFYIIWCEMTCRSHIWRGLLHIWFTAFAIAYLMVMTKLQHQRNMAYHISPVLIFHVDSESEVRIPKFDLCPILWAYLMIMTKNGIVTTSANMAYHISPGPVFHVDSESEVRIPKFYLCQMLWAHLCQNL
jgi:hypothetical protein